MSKNWSAGPSSKRLTTGLQSVGSSTLPSGAWYPRRDLNPHVARTPVSKTGAAADYATRANLQR